MSAAERNIAMMHVDIDSPATLIKFWGLSVDFTGSQLDHFYDTAMERALSLFKECGVPATFFCVGAELERSRKVAALIRQAFLSGHEIANHSFTHPYGLPDLAPSEMRREIQQCSDAIARVTQKKPSGFRSPSFCVNSRLLDLLEELSFEYDSSAFYSVLGPAMKYYHRFFRHGNAKSGYDGGVRPVPQEPYYPDRTDHLSAGGRRGLLEVPLPRSYFGLPFYHNFHLMAGALYRNMDLSFERKTPFPYLFHLIEFCDLSDGIPAELAVHPNLRKPARLKIQAIKKTLNLFKKQYRIMRTDDFAAIFKEAKAGA